jgi:glycosyltransferase involved in cell wall biosynthesis
MSTGPRSVEHDPLVTVIIPAHNAAGRMPALLDALRLQTAPVSQFEVLVVDDCSTDATMRVVADDRIGRGIQLVKRGGPYPARNRGIAEARGSLLAFTDTDCLPHPRWIECGIAAFDDPSVDIVAGRIEVPLGDRPPTPALVDFARHYLDQTHHVANGFGATANMWARKAAFTTVGVFNEELFSGGDHEWGLRATSAGLRLVYSHDVAVTHPPRTRASEIARKQFRIGYGAAQHLYHASGPLRNRPHMCMRPKLYRPPRRPSGMARLAEHGYGPTPLQRFNLMVIEYFCATLPALAGNLTYTVRQRRLPERSG